MGPSVPLPEGEPDSEVPAGPTADSRRNARSRHFPAEYTNADERADPVPRVDEELASSISPRWPQQRISVLWRLRASVAQGPKVRGLFRWREMDLNFRFPDKFAPVFETEVPSP